MRPEDQPSEDPAADPVAGSWFTDPCQDAITTLYSFLDGELTSDRRRQIQRHLDDCGPCLEAFGFEAELKKLIASKCHDEVPESLRRRVVEVLGGEPLGAGPSATGPFGTGATAPSGAAGGGGLGADPPSLRPLRGP